TLAKMFSSSGRKTKRKFSAKDGQRLLAFSQRYRRSASVCSILIHAIFPFLKRLGETKFSQATRLPLQLIRIEHETFHRLADDEPIHNLRDVGDRDAPVKKVVGFD